MDMQRPIPTRAGFAALALVVLVSAPAAAQGVIFVTGDKVGINTDTPTELLHVKDTTDVTVKVEKTSLGSDVLLELVNNGTPRFVFRDTNSGFSWLFEASGSGFLINDLSDGATAEFIVQRNGNVNVEGTLTTGGPSCSTGCDAIFEPGFNRPSIEEHATYMWERGHLPAVGPTLPRQPFNLTEKTAGLLSELEMAHIYIEQLARQLKDRDDEISALRHELERLEHRDAHLEERLARIEAGVVTAD